MNQRDAIIEKAKSIKSLPVSVIRIIKLIQDPDFDMNELINLIEIDPSLTSNLLRIANSAFYSRGIAISSVRDSVMRLGAKNVFQIAVMSTVSPLVKPALLGYDLPPGKLLEHLIAVSVCSENIVKACKIKTTDILYTASLLHDIGKIALGTYIEIDASPITDLAYNEKISFDQAEREILGIDHAELGAILLESWKVPVEIVNAARYHHLPEKCPEPDLIVDLVHIANVFCLMSGVGTGRDGLNYHVDNERVKKYGLDYDITDQVIAQTVLEIEELKESGII